MAKDDPDQALHRARACLARALHRPVVDAVWAPGDPRRGRDPGLTWLRAAARQRWRHREAERLYAHATEAFDRGEYATARARALAALTSLGRHAVRPCHAPFWSLLALIDDRAGDLEASIAHGRMSVACYRAGSDRSDETTELADLGARQLRAHHFADARESLCRALEVSAATDDPKARASAWMGMSDYLTETQQLVPALHAVEAAVAAWCATEDRRGLALALLRGISLSHDGGLPADLRALVLVTIGLFVGHEAGCARPSRADMQTGPGVIAAGVVAAQLAALFAPDLQLDATSLHALVEGAERLRRRHEIPALFRRAFAHLRADVPN